ncbi:MAG TPA: hypothetical protein PL110_11280 [Candidatus Eremiobacteraeota bacterium]|nr:MAG: hypothetical protein BWY64_02024 [bacterium ADurb.Bin363]HPZ08688.1 hypothetical protein [Candidatus Eremiobacteraeota bacterium]
MGSGSDIIKIHIKIAIILFILISGISLFLNRPGLFSLDNYFNNEKNQIIYPDTSKEKKYETEVEIYIDLSKPDTKKAFITMIFYCFSSTYYFKQMGPEKEFKFEQVKFYDKNGAELKYNKNGRNYYLPRTDSNKMGITYSVEPGGLERHARQGYVSEDFAAFDGRIFIMPNNALKINKVKLQFQVPPQWQIINSYRKEGKWYYPDIFGKELVYESLIKSSMIFGDFEKKRKNYGNTDVFVYCYSKWEKERKKTITHKTFRLYEYFFKEFNLNPSGPYIICWLPGTSDNNIFGGTWSNSISYYEKEEDNLRTWEVLSRRIGYSINTYKPTGMVLRDQDDIWFNEGWVSYMEIISLVAAGITEDEYRWNKNYNTYLKYLREHPEYDCPLIDDYKITDPNIKEFLHYYKAPLVIKMLDVEMRLKTGKNMQQFMQYAYKKYGRFKKPFPFKVELEKFTGTSFEEFWNIMIRKKGYIIPVWKEYITSEIKSNINKSRGLIISGEKFSIDYFFYIASNGYVEKYRDLITFAAEEGAYRKKIKSRNTIYPDITGKYIYGFPPQVRYLLRSYEKERLGFTSVEDVTFKPDIKNKSCRILCQLMEMEKIYENNLGKNGITSIYITGNNNNRILAFHYNNIIALHTEWLISGLEASFELLSPNGKIYEKKNFTVEPGVCNTTVNFEKIRPQIEGIWIIRIKHNEKILLERAFWQK